MREKLEELVYNTEESMVTTIKTLVTGSELEGTFDGDYVSLITASDIDKMNVVDELKDVFRVVKDVLLILMEMKEIVWGMEEPSEVKVYNSMLELQLALIDLDSSVSI